MSETEITQSPVEGPRSSLTVGKLAEALAKAQAEMDGAAKDATNPHFKSKYADLASIRDACRPLSKHGIAVLQPTKADGNRVTVTTLLMHSSGEWIAEELTLTALQATPQAVGSAITYGRRYGLASMVGIAPEDDDGEAAEGRGPARNSRRETAPPAHLTNELPPGAESQNVQRPSDFDQWVLDMEATADEGSDALRQAWSKSRKDLQKYMQAHYPTQWTALKARAAKVPSTVPA